MGRQESPCFSKGRMSTKVQFSRDEFEVEEQEVEDDRSLPAGVVQKGVVNSNVRLTMNTLNNSQEISQKVDSLIDDLL